MIQEDTFPGWLSDPLSLNRYTYAHNNPIKYFDPTGHYVSPTDQANGIAKEIQAATDKYNSAPAGPAGDKQRAEAHADAEKARASVGYSGGGDGSAVIVSNGNTTKIVVIEDKTNVNNSGKITTVNVLTGASTSITNSGTIGTINNNGTINNLYNYSSGSIGTINNSGIIGTVSNSGTIGYIYNSNNGTINYVSNNSSGSIGTISNSGTVGSMYNSYNSNIGTISNRGTVTGAINSSGIIGTISNSGAVGSMYIGNNGTIGTISNSGSIVGAITNNGTVGIINNSGAVGSMNMGKSTNTIINNSGDISKMMIGVDSTVNVNNSGNISSVYLGDIGMWFYNTHQSAVAEWASQYAPMSDDVEYGAMIYRTGLGFGTYYFMGETYKGFKTKNWYTVVNGLIAGASVGVVAKKVAAFSSVNLEMMGFAHTHPIGHTNTPSGPDVTMKDIGAFLGYGLFPIAVYNRVTGTVSINYF
jgi:hypothetical protein